MKRFKDKDFKVCKDVGTLFWYDETKDIRILTKCSLCGKLVLVLWEKAALEHPVCGSCQYSEKG